MLATIRNLLNRFLEVLVTVAMGVLVIDVLWQVFTRFAIRKPSYWTEELATFLMIWVGLLGASVALNRGAHLGIDYFVSKLSAKKAMFTVLFSFFCIAVFSLLVLVIGGLNLVKITLQTQQISPALNVKMGYVYLALPISGFFLVFYSVELFIETWINIRKGRFLKLEHDEAAAAAAD